jgi:hypothetical protein
MIWVVKSLKSRLLETAPEQGSGLHMWLIKGARECERSGVEPNEAFDLIAQTVTARGGVIVAKEINKAINKAYSQPYNPGPHEHKSAWPEEDMGLIEEITLLRAWDVPGALATLESRSPEKLNKSSGEIMTRLFPADSLICAGFEMTDTTTFELSRVAKNLHKFSLVVPSPMFAKTGLTQEGKESGRCLGNVGPRRYLVTEFDFKPFNPQGEPTKWVPLIDLWKSHGMSIQDATAGVIMHLAQYGPLVLVVFSGNLSLHAWWACVGESEEEGSRLNGFM